MFVFSNLEFEADFEKCNIVHMLRDPFEWPCCVYLIVKPLYTNVVFRTTASLSFKVGWFNPFPPKLMKGEGG